MSPLSNSHSNPPFDTHALRTELTKFLDRAVFDNVEGKSRKIGAFKWGVYAFYDYDEEPIYVGQTNEKLSTRIRRHLTNQRTDAVAMSVLDPFEVYKVRVWPLARLQARQNSDTSAIAELNALEYSVFQHALAVSAFGAVLNEKLPIATEVIELPQAYDGVIVSPDVYEIRSHPDLRIARRAATLARLAQVISERKVQKAQRLQALALYRSQAFDSQRDDEDED
jgi:hypothetical protein